MRKGLAIHVLQSVDIGQIVVSSIIVFVLAIDKKELLLGLFQVLSYCAKHPQLEAKINVIRFHGQGLLINADRTLAIILLDVDLGQALIVIPLPGIMVDRLTILVVKCSGRFRLILQILQFKGLNHPFGSGWLDKDFKIRAEIGLTDGHQRPFCQFPLG